MDRVPRFNKYADFLSKILDKRWAVIGVAVALVVIAALLIPIVGSEFVPKTDLNEFSIELKLPEGTELYRTEQTVDNIEQIVKAILKDDLKTMYSKIGPSIELSGGESSIFEDENTGEYGTKWRINEMLE